MNTLAHTNPLRSLRAAASVLVTLLAFLGTIPALASQVNAARAASTARGWLRADRTPLTETLSGRIQRVDLFEDKTGDVFYYVVYLDPAGFVIVAADDLVEPIIAFAREGKFDPSTDNPLGALVSSDVPGRVAKARGLGAAAPQTHWLKAREKWQRLEASDQTDSSTESGIGAVSDVRVAPLVVSRWSQSTASGSACYNYYTPPYAAGNTYNDVCGCVATAMAQLIRFHQHPTAGVGTASFAITVDAVPTYRNLRGGDGSGGPYAWASMPLDPSSATMAQRQAIGALTHDAGVSVNMAYASSGSGTDTLSARNALVNTFGYSRAVKGFNAGSSIGSGLNGMINPNLDASHPVLLGITGSVGGHAIVCDGYGYSASTLYHHLNLGWAGMDDAWYALPTVDTSQATFTSVYKCVYNVFVTGTGEIISGRVVDAGGAALAGATVTATRTSGGTYTTTTDTKGIYALAKIPSASQYAISVSKSGHTSANGTYSTGTSSDNGATSGNVWGANFTLASTLGSPNLFPYKPSVWSDKIVVSTTTGTSTDDATLRSTDTLYVDWAVINSGSVMTGTRFYTELYVDGVLKTSWYTDPPLSVNYYTYVTDYSIGSLSAGTHTIRIKTDSTGAITESNESDNEYTKTITVTGANNLAPYKPSSWSDKIVVSTTTGTTTNSSTLRTTDTLYVDWAVINGGPSATATRFYTELYVDGTLRTFWYSDPPLYADYYLYVTDYSIGSLSTGTHTLRIKTDSTGVIAESNESDNEYTTTVTVTGAIAELKADYRFQGNLGSSIGTPPPLDYIGSGQSFDLQLLEGATRRTLSWPAGSGLRLQPTGGVFPSNQYSAVLLFKLADVSGYRRVLDCRQGTSDYGLYVHNGALNFYSFTGDSLVCLTNQTWHQVVLTRDAAGQVKIYCDGLLRLSFTDSSGYAVVSGGELRFFKDDGSENAAGDVCRIRLYASALSVAEVVALDRGSALTAPVIVAQPASHTVGVGNGFGLTVGAEGLLPMTYQWRTNGVNISGATSPTYTNGSVRLSDSGRLFSCLVSNALGSVVSSNALLTVPAPGVNNFTWSPIAPPQTTNTPISVTISARDTNGYPVPSFAGAVALSAYAAGSGPSATIFGNVGYFWSGNNGYCTIGYAFTPNTALQVTHVRHLSGSKVSIWTEDGVLLASQAVSSVPGTWTETPLATPLALAAGRRYRVGVYTAGQTYYRGGAGLSTFNHGTIDQSCEASGDHFPDWQETYNWWLVDLRYSVATAVSITPSVSGNFVNGVWTGNINVLQTASNVVLQANDGAGHYGSSGPFQVNATLVPVPVRFLPGSLARTNGQFQFTLQGQVGSRFEIQATTNLVNWTSLATVTNVTGTISFLDPATNLSRRFYRALQLP